MDDKTDLEAKEEEDKARPVLHKKTKKAARKKSKTSLEEKAIHVKIGQPSRYRKEVLQLAISTIELLKKFEEYKNLRDEKRAKIIELRHVLWEIRKLNSKLDVSKWPYIEISKKMERPKEKTKITTREAARERKPKEISLKKGKVDRLDAEMDSLRNKLMNL